MFNFMKKDVCPSEQLEKQLNVVGDHVDQQQQCLRGSLGQEEELNPPALTQSNGEKV